MQQDPGSPGRGPCARSVHSPRAPQTLLLRADGSCLREIQVWPTGYLLAFVEGIGRNAEKLKAEGWAKPTQMCFDYQEMGLFLFSKKRKKEKVKKKKKKHQDKSAEEGGCLGPPTAHQAPARAPAGPSHEDKLFLCFLPRVAGLAALPAVFAGGPWLLFLVLLGRLAPASPQN